MPLHSSPVLRKLRRLLTVVGIRPPDRPDCSAIELPDPEQFVDSSVDVRRPVSSVPGSGASERRAG